MRSFLTVCLFAMFSTLVLVACGGPGPKDPASTGGSTRSDDDPICEPPTPIGTTPDGQPECAKGCYWAVHVCRKDRGIIIYQ